MNQPALRVAGITDDVTTCGCCGRAGLKRTVVLESETGLRFYGTTCAATALGRKTSEVDSTARGIAYCRRWLHATPRHTALVVANWCRVRFCSCFAVGDTIEFSNGFVVE
jgi:hypothetical protein